VINPLIYFLLFLKASLFSSGGFSNLPSLHQDLIEQNWATENDFGQSTVIGQMTPGPNGLWVIALGYLTYSWWGALLALLAISIPPMVVLLVAAGYRQIEHQHWIPGMMRGVSLAVVAIQMTAAWSIVSQRIDDWRSWVIIALAIIMALSKKVSVIIILIAAGILGWLIYG